MPPEMYYSFSLFSLDRIDYRSTRTAQTSAKVDLLVYIQVQHCTFSEIVYFIVT